jgi:hypothetical protein
VGGDEVRRRAVVGGAPELLVLVCIHQLDGHRETVRAWRDAAGDDGADAQLAGHGREVGVPPLVAEDGGPRDHLQVGQPREPVDEALGQAVAQVVGVRVAARVLEGQDGDGLQGRAASGAEGAESAHDGHARQGEGRDTHSPPARAGPRVHVGATRCVPLRGRDHRDATHEAVPLPHDGLEEPRHVGIVPQRPADLPHRGVDRRVRVEEDVPAPEALEDLGPRHELAPSLGEEDEQLHGQLLELLDLATAAQLVARQVQHEVRRDGLP